MPTYEYECDACGHAFELLQSMSDKAVRKCPKCRKLRVRRLISGGAGVIFKGSGFYETDYRRNRSAASSQSRPKDDGSSSGAGATSPASETKPKPADSGSGGAAKGGKPGPKGDARG